MPKMARNRSALHDVLAQGASYRDITVFTGNTQQLAHQCEIWGVYWDFTVQSDTYSTIVITLLYAISGLILGLPPANDRQRYFVTNVSHWLGGASLESALNIV